LRINSCWKLLKTILAVRVSSDSRFVLWVVDNKQDIIRILSIFDRYPFLTSRTTLQLRFMRHCLQHNDISRYFNERELKYADRSNVISDFSNINLLELPYYPVRRVTCLLDRLRGNQARPRAEASTRRRRLVVADSYLEFFFL